MATLQFPDIVPSSVSWGIKYNTQVNTSHLSGAVQTIEVPGARWVATMSFDGMEAVESRTLASFIAELHGIGGRFYIHDYSHPDPRGSAADAGIVPTAVTVNGANQSGTSIVTAGWKALENNVLLPGDYIQFSNYKLRMVKSAVNTDATGAATITFEPPIAATDAPTDGSTITLTNCKTLMMLTNDEVRWSTNNPGLLTNLTIDCVEGY